MMKPPCTICQLLHHEMLCYCVYEDDDYFVFLDKAPLFLGHCLVAPKQHVMTLFEFPTENLQAYFSLVQKVGIAVQTAMDSVGTFIAINNTVSQSIPHLHTHVVPRKFKDGLKGFFWPRQRYNNETHMLEVQESIKLVLLEFT